MKLLTLLLLVTSASALRADDHLPAYTDHRQLRVWLDDQGAEHPIATPADWAKRRATSCKASSKPWASCPTARS